MRSRTNPPRAGELSAGLRRYLYLTSAYCGAAVLVVEILGAKMLAPYVGTSHFVWTAQIAVTLVALATGYAIGGTLADRWPTLRWLYGALIAAAGWLGAAALVCEPVAFACLRFRVAVGSLCAASALFFVPLALLAMVSPVFVRALTQSLANVGQSVGRLTSISTVGSVAGTLLIGYVLIPFLPNSMTLCVTAAGLVVLSLVYWFVWDRRQGASLAAGTAVTAFLLFLGWDQRPFANLPNLKEVHRRNSNFGMMQIVESVTGTRRYYLNDLLNQDGYDYGEKRSASLFTYMLHSLANAYATETNRVLCIGLGVGLVPMDFVRDGAQVDVVEINPAVVPIAEKYFGFEPSRVRLEIGDGRAFLHEDTNRYDIVVLDAFLGESPPSHLMTREAFAAVRQRLKPEGVLVMNTFGEFEAGRDFVLASLERTLKGVFRSVRLHAAGNGNVFIAASDQPELRARRTPDFAAMPASVRWEAEEAFGSNYTTNPAHGLVLTDNYNPVDYRDAENREEIRRRLAFSYHHE